MRTNIEPPPTSRCSGCGEQLLLKSIGSDRAPIGMCSTIYACASCATEHTVLSHRDSYASQVDQNPRFNSAR